MQNEKKDERKKESRHDKVKSKDYGSKEGRNKMEEVERSAKRRKSLNVLSMSAESLSDSDL